MKRSILAILILITAQSSMALTGKLRCSFVGKDDSHTDLIGWIISNPNNVYDGLFGPYLEIDLAEASKPEGAKTFSKNLTHRHFRGYVQFSLSLTNRNSQKAGEPTSLNLSLEHKRDGFWGTKHFYGGATAQVALTGQEQSMNLRLLSSSGSLDWVDAHCWVAEDR